MKERIIDLGFSVAKWTILMLIASCIFSFINFNHHYNISLTGGNLPKATETLNLTIEK